MFAFVIAAVGLQLSQHLQAQIPDKTSSAKDVPILEVDQPIARELAGGQKHIYQIPLTAGQYIKIEVKPKDIAVGVDFQLPDGQIIRPFQPFGDQSDLTISWMAESSGIYRPTVYAGAKAPAGHYEIRLAELRAATDSDRALQQARDSFAESGRLNREARYLEARSRLMQSLAIREKILGADDLLVGETLAFLGSNYMATGDYAGAEPIKLRALKIFEKVLGASHARLARELAELGGLYLAKGDYVKAEETNQRALSIYESAQLANTAAAASVLSNLGSINHAKGDYQSAEAYYERARVVWEKLLGPDHFHLAPSYTHLGHVAYDAGDYARAELMFQKAVDLIEKGLGPEHTEVSRYLNDLAMVYCTAGDYVKGEGLYRRALSIHEQKAAMGQPAVLDTLFGIARCYASHGEHNEALKWQLRASELEERYLVLNLAVGSEREKLAFLYNAAARLDRNISLQSKFLPNDSTARNLAVTTVLQQKGRVQDAVAANIASLRQRSRPEDQQLFDASSQVTANLAKLVLNGPQKVTTDEYQKQIRTLEDRQEKLDEEISRHSAGFYEHSKSISLAAVQAAIPENAALLEFAVYRPFDPRAPNNQKAYGNPRYVAYVVRNQVDVRSAEIGPAQEIDADVAALREALRDPQQKDTRQLARALDAKLMQPIRGWLGNSTHLLISPDGELNLLPFQALIDEEGRYLIQRYNFTYLTSGRDLLRMQVVRESKSKSLVIANPSFGEPAPGILPETDSGANARAHRGKLNKMVTAKNLAAIYFTPLGGTALEAQAIHALFPESMVLSDTQATETALKQVVAPRILHIATHGFFLQDTDARNDNPLLRSGLALSGANLRTSGNDDGILTALEASGLNLWGTKLVVLSACDTGVGEVRNGEGVYGLRRSFVLAGAESLVMSLWPISDYTTRQLMTHYYQNLKQGMGRGEALRQVQLEMLKKNANLHPFYWANFIQAGDWASIDGKQ